MTDGRGMRRWQIYFGGETAGSGKDGTGVEPVVEGEKGGLRGIGMEEVGKGKERPDTRAGVYAGEIMSTWGWGSEAQRQRQRPARQRINNGRGPEAAGSRCSGGPAVKSTSWRGRARERNQIGRAHV